MIPRQTSASLRATRPSLRALVATSLTAVALSVAIAAVSRAQSGPVQDLSTFPRASLEIHSRSGTHRFRVWVADNQERQTQGLMFVRDVPANEGMLFTNCCSGIWMKNTYVALDILFIGAHHRIAKIVKGARPFDLTTIPAPHPVHDVIELRGGDADALDLKVGDRVQWKMTSPHPRENS